MLAGNESWPLAGRQGEVDAILAALDDPDQRAVVIYGPAGVGKTRLADTCLSLAGSRGRASARIVASHGAALLPLGTLAPILPASLEPDATPAALFQHARAELAALGGRHQLVVFVDDAHLLDTSSAILLTQLLDADAAFIVATIRDGEPLPDAVARWWRRDHTLRIDLRDLGPDGSETVVTTVLGGAVGADTVAQLHRSSGGNPLLLREIVHQALQGGQLSDTSGTWRLTGPITPSRRLIDVLAARLATLAPPLRRVLEQLAVCEQLTSAELTGDVTLTDLEQLERSGLVRVTVDGRRRQVLLGHPLYGEALRAELTTLGRQRILEDAARRIEQLGARRREDTRRVATWCLDAGGTTDTHLLLQATRFARFANDFNEVERLGKVLWNQSRTAETAILLGEAHYELGHFHDAETVLATALPADSEPELLVQRAALRGQNLQWGLGDWQAALVAGVAAREAIGGVHVDDLLIREAGVWTFAGQPQRALDLIAPIEPRTPRTRVLLAIARGQALSMVGRTAEAIEVAIEGYEEHRALAEPLAMDNPGIHIVNQVFALVEAGRLDEADELSRLGHSMTVADNIPFAQIWFALMLGKSALHQGRAAESARWTREAASTARLHGFTGPERVARNALAGTEAQMGEVAAAVASVRQADALPPFELHLFDQTTARAWVTWATGDPEGARKALVANARAAEEAHMVVAAAWAWHDAARLGVRDVAGHLSALALCTDSPVPAARAAHVQAIEADDPLALAAASLRFEELGMLLLAAEAAAAAAGAHRRQGSERAGGDLGIRARTLAGQCQGARTPGLSVLDTTVPLSARELQIALLAQQELSSQEIADRLFLSIRTVNNHLGSVYTKLGIHGRDELAEALHRA